MVDVTSDLAYESQSENSSRINGSNRLSSSSLSGSSLTHSSGNCSRCIQCNKKLTKRKAHRQNAIETDDYLTDPFDCHLPGSQVTLTPDLAPDQHPAEHYRAAALLFLDQTISVTSSISTGLSSQSLYCKQCRQNSQRKKDKSINGTPNSSKKDTGIFSIIKSTFVKLFDSKSKCASKPIINPSRTVTASSWSTKTHIQVEGTVSDDIGTAPCSSTNSWRADSTRTSVCSLGTLSVTTTNDLIHSSEATEFPIEFRTELPYTDYIRTELDYNGLNCRNPRMYDHQARSHACLIPINSCPLKSKSLCSQYSRSNRALLCSSWPPPGQRIYVQDNDFMESCDDDYIMERVERCMEATDCYEFNIPFSDIKLGELVKCHAKRKIYKGHWHGDVTVFMFENLDHEERSRFWENVSILTMIRHENIVLFMGASMEPPHFLMVTSACHGQSLYEKIHKSREKMRQSYKINLMRQIAQAVGYLHARNKPIVVTRLNSRNIYLEPKVVLSLLDYSQLDQDDIELFDHVCITCHLVWYAAPELFDPINRELPRLVPERCFTQSTDVYSFGTLIYEIYMGRYPYSKAEVDEYIVDICSGKRPAIKEIRASETIKSIIRECWSHDPLARFEFRDISRELMKRDVTKKKHSSSVPGNLNRDSSRVCSL